MNKEKLLLELTKKRQATRLDRYNNIGDYHDGIYECDYVSPYSKSAHNVDAEVMIILQDWSSDKSLSGPICMDSVTFGHTLLLPTNRYLKELLKEHCGLELEDIYGTNLFPFIKTGNMSAHIPTKDLKLAALEFALPQIDIISPRIVICLGLATFNALRLATNLKPLKTLSEAIPSPFQYHSSTIYCQAHTGQLGRNNRNRGGVDRVNKDWKVMYNGMNI